MQVASRFVLVWGVVEPFPWLARSQFYTSMLLAWSVTEVIRYSFFALTLSGWQPRTLVWLRYNTFFVLYPIGILSEVMLIYYAAEPAKEYDAVYPWIAYAILAIYIPGAWINSPMTYQLDNLLNFRAGSYILYTHMMK
jgi:very-long-chain (3R)-3-hydroxyacyl-CoA dehydratase